MDLVSVKTAALFIGFSFIMAAESALNYCLCSPVHTHIHTDYPVNLIIIIPAHSHTKGAASGAILGLRLLLKDMYTSSMQRSGREFSKNEQDFMMSNQ